MPTGLKNSPPPFPSNIPTQRRSAVPQPAINITATVVIDADGVPKNSPPYAIALQASVNVRGSNGKPAGNSAPVFVGLTLDEVLNGRGRMITPDTEIFFPVDNAVTIWVNGTAGDGIQVTITANQLG